MTPTDTICGYCERTADHNVLGVTVCDSDGCDRLARRDHEAPTPLPELLARYSGGRDTYA